MPKFQEQ